MADARQPCGLGLILFPSVPDLSICPVKQAHGLLCVSCFPAVIIDESRPYPLTSAERPKKKARKEGKGREGRGGRKQLPG